jgi:hypothetical protein
MFPISQDKGALLHGVRDGLLEKVTYTGRTTCPLCPAVSHISWMNKLRSGDIK